VNVTVYTDAEVFDLLREEWNPLVQRSVTNTIFLTWEWQSAWWHTYQAGRLWVLACRADDGQLIGIGPWFIHNLDGERVLRTIGCVDVTDYVDVIADRDHAEAVHAQFASYLREHADEYDRINLCNIPEESTTLELLPARLNACGFFAENVLQEVCPIIQLPDTWEGYLENLDKKQRHELRRKLRRAEESEIEHVIVDHTHDLEAMIEQFLSLMKASHPQKARFLEDEKNRAFFKRVLPIVFANGWLKLSFLMVNGTATATYCDFDYQNHILVYNSGLLPEQHANLSPGIVLLCLNIRHAIETGHSVFDFLRGNETYKYRMGAMDTRVFKLRAQLRERIPETIEGAHD